MTKTRRGGGEARGGLQRREPQTTATLPVHVAKDLVVRRMTDAKEALAKAASIDQVKLVMDAAAAQKVFVARQRLGKEAKDLCHEVEILALARLGELLKPLVKAKGSRGTARGRDISGGTILAPPESSVPTLADLGITKKVAAVAQQLAILPEKTREAIARSETSIAKVRREQKAAEIRKKISLPEAKYRVIYADPPWAYNDKADEGAIQAGGAARHYPSMSIADLCAMPLTAMCEDNAVLFLWVTSPLLFESAPVIKAWGFAYKASFVWDKVKHNMGHYNSVRHEFLLLCTRGSCTPDVVELFDSVQSIERTTHSTKPEEFRRIIDTLYPNGKRIELFRRGDPVPTWDSYGYEAVSA